MGTQNGGHDSPRDSVPRPLDPHVLRHVRRQGRLGCREQHLRRRRVRSDIPPSNALL